MCIIDWKSETKLWKIVDIFCLSVYDNNTFLGKLVERLKRKTRGPVKW